MIPRCFRIPFDVASRDKDAFSRHTPQQTFVRQRVNGVANRLPGRSILIRRLIFGGQRRTGREFPGLDFIANDLAKLHIQGRQSACFIHRDPSEIVFSYQAPKYFSVSVALAAPFCMASSMGSPSTMPYRKPAI